MLSSTILSLNFEFPEMSRIEKLKILMLSHVFPNMEKSYRELTSYDLVKVLVDEDGIPIKRKESREDVESYFIFTSEHLSSRIARPYNLNEFHEKSFDLGKKLKLKTMMLGEMIRVLSHCKGRDLPVVKVNPVLLKLDDCKDVFSFSEEVLFSPLFDTFTKKYLLCDPENARALLAMNPEDVQRFGIELVFDFLTDRDLPEDLEERERILKARLEELSFILPRIPMRKGSGSFLTIVLNLENEFEELAFIREYKTFDRYCDVIFVTSSLKLMSGTLEEIHYDGRSIDSIFGPLIKWQR